jgi:hypothetical protein
MNSPLEGRFRFVGAVGGDLDFLLLVGDGAAKSMGDCDWDEEELEEEELEEEDITAELMLLVTGAVENLVLCADMAPKKTFPAVFSKI